jgi:hypothetical protein
MWNSTARWARRGIAVCAANFFRLAEMQRLRDRIEFWLCVGGLIVIAGAMILYILGG